MHLRWYKTSDLTNEDVAHWRNLSRSASSPNIYLMPDFLLPAVRHLEGGASCLFAVVWDATRSTMLALAAFNEVPPSWLFPYWSLKAVKSKHSFQSGILLRTGREHETIDYLLDRLLAGRWRAIEFSALREQTLLYQQLHECAERKGLKWFVHRRYERANLLLRDGSPWRSHISKSRHKNLRRARARLAELGRLETRISFGEEVSDATIEDFLRLESSGWKADSSLLSTPQGLEFFMEMAKALRSQGALFFCELLLNGRAIASSANFFVSDMGFAFKVGMDPEYAKFSPGNLLEYGFLEASERRGFPFREIESGAFAGSHIEALWPDRITMVSGRFVVGTVASAFSRLGQALKSARTAIPQRGGSSRISRS